MKQERQHQTLLEPKKHRLPLQLQKKLSGLALPLDQQPKSANGVPVIVEACLRYLTKNATHCEGLFRVPGCASRVQEMWDYMQHHPCARMSINCINVFMRSHKKFNAKDVASFLKRFIKTIVGNEPVITYNCYAPLVELFHSRCPSHLIAEKYRHIIGQLLVPARRLLLERLCNFLRDFSRHKDETHMSCSNLAVCFGNLLKAPDECQDHSSPVTKRKSVSKHNRRKSRALSAAEIRELVFEEGRKTLKCVSVIETLIRNSEDIFTQSPMSCSPIVSPIPSKLKRGSSGFQKLNDFEYVSF